MKAAVATVSDAAGGEDGRPDQGIQPGYVVGYARRDLLLAAITAGAALLNATAYIALGKVFASFMTGNIVFLGIELAGWPDGPSIWKPLIALGAFGIGAAAAAKLVRSPPADDAMWSLKTTRGLIAVASLETLYFAWWIGASGRFSNTVALALIGISACSMGLQTGAVFFSLGVRAVFTTAATATWMMFAENLETRSRARHELPRLTAVLASLLIGSLVGAALVLHARTWAPLPAAVLTWATVVLAVKWFHRDLHHESSSVDQTDDVELTGSETDA